MEYGEDYPYSGEHLALLWLPYIASFASVMTVATLVREKVSELGLVHIILGTLAVVISILVVNADCGSPAYSASAILTGLPMSQARGMLRQKVDSMRRTRSRNSEIYKHACTSMLFDPKCRCPPSVEGRMRHRGRGPCVMGKEPARLRGALGWEPNSERKGAGALLSQNRNRRRSRATEGGLRVKVESAALNFQRQERGWDLD